MFSSYAKPGNDTIEKETGYGLRWVRLCVHLLRGKKVHKLSCPEIGIVRCEKRDGSGGKAPRDLTVPTTIYVGVGVSEKATRTAWPIVSAGVFPRETTSRSFYRSDRWIVQRLHDT